MSLITRAATDQVAYSFPCDLTPGIMGGNATSSYTVTRNVIASTSTQSPSGGTGSINIASSGTSGLQFTQPDVGPVTNLRGMTIEAVFRYDGDSSASIYEHNGAYITINDYGSGPIVYGSMSITNEYTGTASSTTPLVIGNWYYVALTWGDIDEKVRLYVNGTAYASATNYGFNGVNRYYGTTHTIGLNSGLRLDWVGVYSSAYSGITMTSQKLADRYTELATAFAALANGGYTAEAMTATAASPSAVITAVRSPNIAASPMTASAEFTLPSFNTISFPAMLDSYLSTLGLEQWYKFDDNKTIKNYGSGGQPGWSWYGSADTVYLGGKQGSGALKITGKSTDGYLLSSDTLTFTPEITDENFAIGFWIKGPSGAYNQGANIFTVSGSTGRFVSMGLGTSGLTYNVHTTHDHILTGTDTVLDGNWHFVVGTLNGGTSELFIDNVSQGTISVSSNLSSLTLTQFSANSGASNASNPFYISNFMIAPTSVITGTVRTNMVNAAAVPIQASAGMPTSKIKFNNKYNYLNESSSAVLDLRFDESSGSPVSFGTQSVSLAQVGTNVTRNIATKNRFAYEFTNRDTYFTAGYTYPTGTFSTNNQQTAIAYVKLNSSAAGVHHIVNHGLGGNGVGVSLALQQVTTTNQIRVRITDESGFDQVATSGSYNDNTWHHVAAVMTGSTLYLYIDGKEIGSVASTKLLTDSGNLNIGGQAGATAGSRDMFIDEVSVFNTAFTAQQIFEHYQALTLDDGTMTASGLLVMPTDSLGYGPTISATALTASALLVMPTQQDELVQLPTPITAFATIAHPNFAAYKNVDYVTPALTASALFHMPQYSIGEINAVDAMFATASFPAAYARLPDLFNASPAIADANMVNPALSTTRGALVKPQSLNAKAFMPIPPAYVLLTDDIWFTRLYAQQKANTTAQKSFLHFFNETSNIVAGATITSQDFNAYTGTASGINTAILPRGYVGFYDNQQRTAVKLQNIALDFTPTNASAASYAITDRGYTMEFMVKTSKSEQVMFTGDWASETSNQKRKTAIGLYGGKLYVMQSYLALSGTTPEISAKNYSNLVTANLSPTIYQATKTTLSNDDWHHVIIQMGYDSRLQIWVDGALEYQNRDTGAFPYPTRIGYNSADAGISSEFYVSAVSINPQQFLLTQDVDLNYYAAVNYTPIRVSPMTASATLTAGTKARGNRGRALMLYFWSTWALGNDALGNSYNNGLNSSRTSLQRTTQFDQGQAGDFDFDTFFPLSTWEGVGREFYDWDIFPIDVEGYYPSAVVKPESYDNARPVTFYSGQSNYTYLVSDGFKDELDNRRYVDLMNDINIEDFDMICFRNYPDQGSEMDSFKRNESVDNYFGIKENTLFESFLKSLRAAVDTGISLYISNPMLAVDLGIVDRIEEITDLDDKNIVTEDDGLGDPYAYQRVTTYPVNGFAGDIGDLDYGYLYDTYKNNRHRVVNTVTGLTDEPGYILTEKAYFESIDARRFAEPNREWSHVVYKPSGLTIGDEFIFNSMPKIQAVPLANVKAGKAITTFGNKTWTGVNEINNPYANYATTIAVQPGDILNGTQCGGKIFVNFVEPPSTMSEEIVIEIKSNYWIDRLLADGEITQTEAIELKAAEWNIDKKLTDGTITQAQYDYEKYWDMNGVNFTASAQEYPGSAVKLTVYSGASGKVLTKKKALTKAGKRKGVDTGTGSGTIPAFTIAWGPTNPTNYVRALGMISRAWFWLSERDYYVGTPQRPLALIAEATIPMPSVLADKDNVVRVQTLIANATLVEFGATPNRTMLGLPMYAEAKLNGAVRPYYPAPGVITAYMPQDVRVSSFEMDEVVLYVMHEDPILYIREDVIK